MTARGVALSVVVVAYGMARELPRTVRSLSVPYQRGIDVSDYEVIVVDNGSPQPVAASAWPAAGVDIRLHRIDEASASPAHAANVGIGLARGELIGLIVDGARLASPGLLAGARAAAQLGPRAVVTAPAWHLGPALHARAQDTGYDQAAEDGLLDRASWEHDGDELFAISTPAASSGRGLFGAMGESSSLFLGRALWAELGGLDERYCLPGGGLVNHDLYRRACASAGARLVVLLGEGTFHQLHGGASTSGHVSGDEARAEYEAICGEPHRPPSIEPTFLGRVPPQYLPYVAASIEQAARRRAGAVQSPPAAG